MSSLKRRHSRHRTSITARIRVRGSFTWLDAKVHNLSRGGILVETERNSILAVGDPLEIEFNTTDEAGHATQRRFFGKTMWRRGVRYGVEFKSAGKVR